MKTRTLDQPAANALSLVRAVVFQDEMYVEFCGHVLLDSAEETTELAGAMTTMELTQHFAAGHVKSGEQTGRAVTLIVVAPALDLSGRMGRSGAVRSSA